MKELTSVLNHFGQSFLIVASPEQIDLSWGAKLKQEVVLGDFWGGYFNQVKIEDIRELKLWHSQKSQSAGRYALLAAPYFTREAQTALLKITEEPNSDTVVILATKNPNDLLPTLRSRLQLIKVENSTDESDNKFKQFAKATPANRLLNQKKFVDLEAENHREQLADLISGLKKLVSESKLTNLEVVKVLTKAEQFVRVTGLSAKNTYDYLAITLPILD